MNATEMLTATDHRGDLLFPGAYIVAQHGTRTVIGWYSRDALGELTIERRTIVDSFGNWAPAILGDEAHVLGWLKGHPSITTHWGMH